MKLTGVPSVVPNDVMETNSAFYVSYNNRDSFMYGSDTTALVKGQMEKFYILNGDHREAYKALMEAHKDSADHGFNVCLAYFQEHQDEKSNFSD